MRTVKVYNEQHPLYPVICECIKRKDLVLTQMGTHPQKSGQIVIQDKNLTVWGTTTAIQYLEDKFPHPPFFPNDPEKSAVIRMAIQTIERNPLIIDEFEDQIPEEGFFGGYQPCALDYYLYALGSTERWSDFRNRFGND